MDMPTGTKRTVAPFMRTAYHEAGHTVVYCALGMRFAEVSIIPDDQVGTRGHVASPWPHQFKPDDDVSDKTFGRIEQYVMTAWAGSAAEMLFTGSQSAQDMTGDVARVNELVDYLGDTPTERKVRTEYLRLKTRRILSQPWNHEAVGALVSDLLKMHLLKYRSVKALYGAVVAQHEHAGLQQLATRREG